MPSLAETINPRRPEPGESHSDLQFRQKVGKLIAITVLAHMPGMAGDTIDRLGDHFSDAGAVIESSVDIGTPSIDSEEELDGIPFSQYSRKAQQKLRQEQSAEYDKKKSALDTVAELFQALDENGEDGISKKAEAYRQEHADDFISAEKLNEVQQKLTEASSNNEVMATLGNFMDEVNIVAGFTDENSENYKAFNATTDVDQTRAVAQAYIDVFAPLPKSFIDLAKLKTVRIANFNGTVLGGAVGEYEGPDFIDVTNDKVGILTMPTQEVAASLASKAEDFLEGGDGADMHATVAHELGHALRFGISPHSPSTRNEVDPGKSVAEQMFWQSIGRPEVPSAYSRTSEDELDAEQISGLLSHRSQGLVGPDNWREFSSPANIGMIEELIRFEEEMPGIAAVILSNHFGVNTPLKN